MKEYEYYIDENPGQPRWAETQEIKEGTAMINPVVGRYSTGGLPVFAEGKDIYVDPSDAHTLIYGCSGSKKTRLFVFPTVCNLLNAGESVIVTDPKGEIYDRCAGLAKATGHQVYSLNLRDLHDGNRWNPLAEPYRLYKDPDTRDQGIAMLNDFIETIAAKEKSGSVDPFWERSASSLALGLALLLFRTASGSEEVNITSLTTLCHCTCNSTELKNLWEILRHLPEDDLCRLNLSVALNAPDKTRQCISMTLFSMISAYSQNRSLQEMLSSSDFYIEELTDKPFALFLILPDESTKYNDLATAFISQSYQIFIQEAQKYAKRTLPIRVNYVLDEFNNIPALPDAVGMLSAARSRNIRFYLVAQGRMSQYEQVEDVLKANCTNWVFLTSRDQKLLLEISALCGNLDGGRPLISTFQLQHLSKEKGEALMLVGRKNPYIAQFPDIDQYAFPRILPPRSQRRKSVPLHGLTISQILKRITG